MAKIPIQWSTAVRYSECDPQGVVFNAHYLTYFDCTINEAFRNSGIDWLEKMRESGCDVQLVKSVIEYRKPLRFDETITCTAHVQRIGTSSICWELHIYGGDSVPNEDLRAQGEIVWVYANIAESQSQPLPDWLRHHLQRFH